LQICIQNAYENASKGANAGWTPPTTSFDLKNGGQSPPYTAGFAYPGTGETPVPLIGGDVVGGGP